MGHCDPKNLSIFYIHMKISFWLPELDSLPYNNFNIISGQYLIHFRSIPETSGLLYIEENSYLFQDKFRQNHNCKIRGYQNRPIFQAPEMDQSERTIHGTNRKYLI